MKRFVTRTQAKVPMLQCLLAGLGGGLAIAALGYLSRETDMLWLFAPFGASCVLLFAVPASPLSQPANVVLGYAISTAVAYAGLLMLPDIWWSLALVVGAAIALMAYFRVTHPPAGAAPLVVFAAHPEPMFLLFPILTGAAALVAMATVYHRLRGHSYPNGV